MKKKISKDKIDKYYCLNLNASDLNQQIQNAQEPINLKINEVIEFMGYSFKVEKNEPLHFRKYSINMKAVYLHYKKDKRGKINKLKGLKDYNVIINEVFNKIENKRLKSLILNSSKKLNNNVELKSKHFELIIFLVEHPNPYEFLLRGKITKRDLMFSTRLIGNLNDKELKEHIARSKRNLFTKMSAKELAQFKNSWNEFISIKKILDIWEKNKITGIYGWVNPPNYKLKDLETKKGINWKIQYYDESKMPKGGFSYLAKEDLELITRISKSIRISGAKYYMGNHYSQPEYDEPKAKSYFTIKVEGILKENIRTLMGKRNVNAIMPRIAISTPCPPVWKPIIDSINIITKNGIVPDKNYEKLIMQISKMQEQFSK